MINLTEEEKREIIEYGKERIKSNITGVIIILVIGIVFNLVLESFIFSISFFLQRRYAGGYHADTKWRCYIISIFLITVSIFAIKIFDARIFLNFVLQTFNIFLIYLLAPVGTANRNLDIQEFMIFRRKIRFISIIIYILCSICTFNEWIIFANSLLVSNCLISFLLIVGYIKNKFIKRKELLALENLKDDFL